MSKPLTTLGLAKIIEANMDRIVVFTPPSLDEIKEVCINGNAVQINMRRTGCLSVADQREATPEECVHEGLPGEWETDTDESQASGARIAPCPCRYWVDEGPEDYGATPQALYDPETGEMSCIECGRELMDRSPKEAIVPRRPKMSKQEKEVRETLRWAARFAEGRRDLQRQTEAGSGLDNPFFNAWIERCNRCLASMGVREDGRLDEEVKEAKDA